MLALNPENLRRVHTIRYNTQTRQITLIARVQHESLEHDEHLNLSRDETRDADSTHFDLESLTFLLQIVRGGFGGSPFHLKTRAGANPIEYTRRVHEPAAPASTDDVTTAKIGPSAALVDQSIPNSLPMELTPKQVAPAVVMERASRKHDTGEQETLEPGRHKSRPSKK
jgi:hypothetical protein